MKKNAFTMSEALIVLGIVAVLAALSVIALKNSKPDVDMVLYRHSYSKVRKVVSELLNDTELYPFVTNESATKKTSSGDKLSQYNIIELGLGLKDTSINVDALKNSGIDLNGATNTAGAQVDATFGDACTQAAVNAYTPFRNSYYNSSTQKWTKKSLAGNEITGTANVNYAKSKFACSFADRLNPMGLTLSGNKVTLTTSDGVYWEIEDNFYTGTDSYITIYINGESSKSKSCMYKVVANDPTCKTPDKFIFKISNSGRIKTVASDKSKVDPMACSYLKYFYVLHKNKIPKNSSVNTCFSS